MGQPESIQRRAMTQVPRLMRLLDKIVLEVLPATLASVIGGLLLAHYQASHPDTAPAAAAASPASPEMVRLVRDEHALLRQFLAAQETVQQQIAADAQDAQATARLPAAKGHAGAALAAAKPALPRHRTASAATAPLAVSPAPRPPAVVPPAVVIARAQQIPGPAPAAAPVHAGPLIADTLAAKDQVVGAALHAVKAIGGIPIWIGRRLGGDDLNAQPAGTAL